MTWSNAGGFRWRAMKPSASSDCSKGANTATMSSTTASLIARFRYSSGISAQTLRVCREESRFPPIGAWPEGMLLRSLLWRSMQARRLEHTPPVDRGQHHVEGYALVVDRERHIDTRGSERPELSIKLRLAGDLLALDGQDDIAGLELGARRRPLCGDADHHQLVLDLGREHPEPGPRRLVDTTEFAQIVDHRLEQIDRHDHVDVFGLALALALELQRTDADQFAAVRDQRGAAPIGMRRIGEDRLVQQILPVTGVLLDRK